MAIERNQKFLDAFGNRIKELRMQKGLSMRAMADILNVDIHQFSRIEGAEIATSIMMAYRLAEVLEVTMSVLFDFEVESAE